MSDTQQARMLSAFVRQWVRSARRGECDSIGGAEFRRLFSLYIDAGYPRAQRAFIIMNANRSPNSHGEPHVQEVT